MDSPIRIVKRDTIPPLQAAQTGPGEATGELRDFRWHDELRAFMPRASDLAVGWVRLGPGELSQPRALDVDLLMVVYEGSADIVGDLSRAVAAEDVVVVPRGCKHGFVGGPQGLSALSIRLGEVTPTADREQQPDAAHTLQGLLEYNAARFEEFQNRTIFELLADGALDDPGRQAVYRQALRFWAARSRDLLLVRQACCVDRKYARSFLTELADELNGTSTDPAAAWLSPGAERDPILIALADWFTRQMYIRDNVEKVALVDLVVAYANAALGRHDEDARLWVHGHGERATETSLLLRGETPQTYARLRLIVAEAWDMVGALSDRIVELTQSARSR
jgi:FAD/FMN-containing dehydrogenase